MATTTETIVAVPLSAWMPPEHRKDSPGLEQETTSTPASLEDTFQPTEPAAVVRAKQKWNEPAINKWRMLATFASFAVIGANDAAYGALVPYVRDDFGISTTAVSVIFITPFAGYTVATAFVNKLHMTFGQRGIAIIGPLCHLIPFIVIACHPPFPVVIVVFAFIGLGNGLIDAAWNAWIGDMANANALMGFLHAFYGLGATISPAIATAMIGRGLGWWSFYYTMIGAASLELISSTALFWPEDAKRFRLANPKTTDEGSNKGRTVGALKSKIVWILAAFLFVYMGVEVSIGGWIVEFMMHARGGGAVQSGLVPTGFWLGITVGRLVLGFATERMGERLAVVVYLALSLAMQLVFWLVPNFIASAVSVSFIGFFTGPLFPAAIVVAAKLLPKHLHTAGIGIACAFAGAGASVLPFIAGAIAGAEGVRTLQPFILSLLVTITVLWLLLPRTKKAGAQA